MTEPPELPGSQGSDRAAWGCYGAIIFWLTRPGLDKAEVTEKCAPYAAIKSLAGRQDARR